MDLYTGDVVYFGNISMDGDLIYVDIYKGKIVNYSYKCYACKPFNLTKELVIPERFVSPDRNQVAEELSIELAARRDKALQAYNDAISFLQVKTVP